MQKRINAEAAKLWVSEIKNTKTSDGDLEIHLNDGDRYSFTRNETGLIDLYHTGDPRQRCQSEKNLSEDATTQLVCSLKIPKNSIIFYPQYRGSTRIVGPCLEEFQHS